MNHLSSCFSFYFFVYYIQNVDVLISKHFCYFQDFFSKFCLAFLHFYEFLL